MFHKLLKETEKVSLKEQEDYSSQLHDLEVGRTHATDILGKTPQEILDVAKEAYQVWINKEDDTIGWTYFQVTENLRKALAAFGQAALAKQHNQQKDYATFSNEASRQINLAKQKVTSIERGKIGPVVPTSTQNRTPWSVFLKGTTTY